MAIASGVVSPLPAAEAEGLRRAAQEFLDRWYPGTAVTVDWTGEAFLLQLARGFRLAETLWIGPREGQLEADFALARKLLMAAWRLAREGGE